MNDVLNDIIFDNYIVVGVSAGPDSMCLLDLLRKKTDKIIVCHINHNVRKESEKEEKFLKEYCKEHNLIFETTKIESYHENNFENEARKRRYKFYEKTLKKYQSNTLFLAHHGDDLIETVLMKIMRGSNIEGYAGIKEKSKLQNYQIIRPLINKSKEGILKYNESHNIPYFIDSSNKNINYTRNRYRKNIVPLLKKEDKNAHKKFLKFSKTLLEYDNYIKKLVMEKLNTFYKNKTIYINNFNKLDTFLKKNCLYYIMNCIYQNKNNIITERHINNILSLIESKKPNLTLNLPKGIILTKEYDKLYIRENIEDTKEYKILFKDEININNLTIKKVKEEEKDNNSICRINSKSVKMPLYFRNRKMADYIILKNSNYRKKIKEIFIEEKIPISQRNSYPMLVDKDDNIIWIPCIKKSKFCIKKEGKYDIILKCNEREDLYE